MQLTEARVGLLAIAVALGGSAIVLWADVREHEHRIGNIEAESHDFRIEYDAEQKKRSAKEQKDEDVNEIVEVLKERVRNLELVIAARHGAR